MQVILRENVENLGRVGDIVKVSDGYARNFLLPRNLVFVADEGNVRVIENHKKQLEKRAQQMKLTAEEQAKALSTVTVSLSRKVGEHEKLFGSVSAGDIAEALARAGHKVERRWVQIVDPIKSLGTFNVSVRLMPEVTATIKVVVTKEN
ncbi:MAG: 50S ribosomal protein L9 [Bdellovibrionales bacterium]|nr:50S ribosomal protein L9 [Bdellovibrionales bacterium]